MTDTYNLDRRPPCWPVGEQCPNSCAADLHRRVVTNHLELTGPWLAGAWLGATWLHRAANGSQNAGCADCSGMPMPATYGIRSAGGMPNARRFSSRWSRWSWWILANGENATSDASQDKALSVGAMPLHPSSADVDSGKFNRWAAPEIVTPIVQRLLPSIAYATNDATLGARHAGRLCLCRAQGRNVKNGLRWTGAPHRMRHGILHAEIDSFAVGMNPRARIIGEQPAAVQFRNSDDVALRVDPMKTRASR